VDGRWMTGEEEPIEYVGRRLLVGLTILDENEQPLQRVEVHGTVSSATEGGFLEIQRADGRGVFRLPFEPESLTAAAPGEYTLRSTGEVVTDPDFTTVWSVKLAPGGTLDDIVEHGFPT
jgi:hypothetical protein